MAFDMGDTVRGKTYSGGSVRPDEAFTRALRDLSYLPDTSSAGSNR